jgi:asparagine synthase (glutamine-hydrolysing)
MCGIFFYAGPLRDVEELQALFRSIQHRGPDSSQLHIVYPTADFMLVFGFHRLAINGQSKADEQPFVADKIFALCNGEIWNHVAMRDALRLQQAPCAERRHDEVSQSDCRCLLPYYQRHGVAKMCQAVDGVFACIIYNGLTDTVSIARDPVGIRSLYWHQDGGTGALFVASELKALPCHLDDVMQVPPGHVAADVPRGAPVRFMPYGAPRVLAAPTCESPSHGALLQRLRETLERAVEKRLMSDRSVGCILSGGLDSTLVTAIVCKLQRARGVEERMRTYTVGMAGGSDLKWARLAAEHLGTEHHEFVVSERDFLAAIPDVVRQIESFDVTTVRASVGNWLVAQKIAALGKDVVLFCGDVADELLGGYRGFGLARSAADFEDVNRRMMRDVHCFDVLRSEKSFTGHGLEGRVPFADRDFVAAFETHVPTAARMWGSARPGGYIEKQLLREAFEGYLPRELLWRRKEAFSDGVSGEARSWYVVIQEHLARTGASAVMVREHMPPYDAESAYYRALYEASYASVRCIPYFWKQPFTTVSDPSARTLTNY